MPLTRERSVVYSDLPLFDPRRNAATRANDADSYAAATGVADYDVSETRSGNQGGSEAANAAKAETKQRDRELVYAEVVRAGARGLTCAEFCEWAGKSGQLARVSGRFSELKHLGLIGRRERADGTPILRGGCGIWVAVSRL